jgi:serine-type D-Ala-D-Ala carboxypeptidase (penicillin-binding protein 5/6)
VLDGRRTRVGSWLSIATLISALTVLALPGSGTAGSSKLELTARSYVAIDETSGRVLVQGNDQVRRPIASLTKVMTGLIVAERGHLNRRVLVTPQAVDVEPEVEGLVVGRRYRRITLLYSALMVSSNDSATALAIDGGGGSISRFYALMNARARAIGMTDTTYASASGLNDTTNLSTALDQARLARFALQNRTVARIVGTHAYRTRWAAPTYAKIWINHNKMLGSTPGVFGVKTGWTTLAGGCLIIAIHRDGHDVIAVLLDSQSIWSDMDALLNRAASVDA